MISLLYLLNGLLVLGLVFAAIDPAGARRWVERLGLAPLLHRFDADGTRRLLGFVGKFLVLASLLLTLSVLTGHHSLAWLVPAGETAFFGLILWLSAAFDARH